MSILKIKPVVSFDPFNKDHVQALHEMLTLGRQHETLRFDIEGQFTNVVDMTKHLAALAYTSQVLGKEFKDVRIEDPLKATEADLDILKVVPINRDTHRSTPKTKQRS